MHINLSKSMSEVFLPYNQTRKISKIVYRLKLNAWATKYTKDIHCICSTETLITVQHILCDCPVLMELYKQSNISFEENTLKKILLSEDLLRYIDVILKTSIGKML